jgi:hypothetical protein
MASAKGCIEVAKWLIANGADINVKVWPFSVL